MSNWLLCPSSWCLFLLAAWKPIMFLSISSWYDWIVSTLCTHNILITGTAAQLQETKKSSIWCHSLVDYFYTIDGTYNLEPHSSLQ